MLLYTHFLDSFFLLFSSLPCWSFPDFFPASSPELAICTLSSSYQQKSKPSLLKLHHSCFASPFFLDFLQMIVLMPLLLLWNSKPYKYYLKMWHAFPGFHFIFIIHLLLSQRKPGGREEKRSIVWQAALSQSCQSLSYRSKLQYLLNVLKPCSWWPPLPPNLHSCREWNTGAGLKEQLLHTKLNRLGIFFLVNSKNTLTKNAEHWTLEARIHSAESTKALLFLYSSFQTSQERGDIYKSTFILLLLL